jgi:preprotein translocase subunit SecF
MRRDLHIDFVNRWRTWFAISGTVVLIAIGALILRGGLNLSIEFVGGSSYTLTGVSQDVTEEQLEDAATDAGAEQVRVQVIEDGQQITGAIVATEALEPGGATETAVEDAIRAVAQPDDVEFTFVGPTWGQRISQAMLQALAVFLLVVVLYITVRLEFKMAMVALVALVHDLLFAAGVYALFQFPVSPPTVIAFLTILGYSLYDTVIVFDRVKENTDRLGGPGRRSYGQAVNTSMNDVLWRSVNTTISSALPVAGLLFIGSQLLGATTLFDLALALFIGMITGAYSSLFLAGPMLALWREREPRLAELKRRAELRDEEPVPAEATTAASGGGDGAVERETGVATAAPPRPPDREEPASRSGDEPDRGGRKPRSADGDGEGVPEHELKGLEPRGYVRGQGKKKKRRKR